MGRMSARMIGRELGCMTAQEVNMLLCEEGYLEGEPGDYTVTEKGAPYAEERDYHRGTGGYATYNRYWTTRSWDDSILDAIGDVSPERRRELTEKVAQHRDEAHRRNFGLDNTVDDEDEDDGDYVTTTSSDDDYVDIDGKSVAIIIGVIAGGFLLVKGAKAAAPHVQKWWGETAKPALTAAKDRVAAKFGRTGAAEQAEEAPEDPVEMSGNEAESDTERDE